MVAGNIASTELPKNSEPTPGRVRRFLADRFSDALTGSMVAFGSALLTTNDRTAIGAGIGAAVGRAAGRLACNLGLSKKYNQAAAHSQAAEAEFRAMLRPDVQSYVDESEYSQADLRASWTSLNTSAIGQDIKMRGTAIGAALGGATGYWWPVIGPQLSRLVS